MGFAPGFSYLGIHQKRNRQRDCGFHLLAHQLPHLLGGFLRGLNNEFIVNLQNKTAAGTSVFRRRYTRTMAILIISAAVPWMGAFIATRSPKARCTRLEAFSSGRGRRRPNSVSA